MTFGEGLACNVALKPAVLALLAVDNGGGGG